MPQPSPLQLLVAAGSSLRLHRALGTGCVSDEAAAASTEFFAQNASTVFYWAGSPHQLLPLFVKQQFHFIVHLSLSPCPKHSLLDLSSQDHKFCAPQPRYTVAVCAAVSARACGRTMRPLFLDHDVAAWVKDPASVRSQLGAPRPGCLRLQPPAR